MKIKKITYKTILNDPDAIDSKLLWNLDYYNVRKNVVVNPSRTVMICFKTEKKVDYEFLEDYQNTIEPKNLFKKNEKRNKMKEIELNSKADFYPIYFKDNKLLFVRTVELKGFKFKKIKVYFNPVHQRQLCFIHGDDRLWLVGTLIRDFSDVLGDVKDDEDDRDI